MDPATQSFAYLRKGTSLACLHFLASQGQQFEESQGFLGLLETRHILKYRLGLTILRSRGLAGMAGNLPGV